MRPALTTAWPFAAVCFAIAAQGCARQQPQEQTVDYTARKVTSDPATDSTKTMPSKEEFERGLDRKLERLDAELRELRGKVANLTDSGKSVWTEKMTELEAKRKAAEAKLDEIRKSTGEAWEHLRDGAKNAWEELEQAVKNARSAASP